MTQGRVKRCAAGPADSRSWPCPTATCRCSPTCSQPPGSPGTACCPVSWCTPTSRTRPCTAWPWNAWRSTRPGPLMVAARLLGPARRRSPRAAHRLHPARRRRRARSTGRLRPHSPRPGGPPRAAAYRDATTVIPASELCRSTAWDIASKNRGTREMRQERMPSLRTAMHKHTARRLSLCQPADRDRCPVPDKSTRCQSFRPVRISWPSVWSEAPGAGDGDQPVTTLYTSVLPV